MTTDLFNGEKATCSIISTHHFIKNVDAHKKVITVNNKLEQTTFQIQGNLYLVWPNREGEGFNTIEANKKLLSLNKAENGISLSYPATASCLAFFARCESGKGFLIFATSDNSGSVCETRLKRVSRDILTIDFTGIIPIWNCIQFDREVELEIFFAEKKKSSISLKKQFQMGLIDPYGHTLIPEDSGFLVIPQTARMIKEIYGPEESNIHIFGYGKGHDLMYPDYTPNEILGGKTRLSEALKETKDLGFETSFYLNGRIIDKNALAQFPSIVGDLLRDSKGDLIEEKYQDRVFYIVDPSSSSWRDCLLHWANLLAECGVDTVQLDQLGGRASLKGNGEIWGDGYNKIIEGIHELDLKVWIQGVSDYYKADWFEMTYRDLEIQNEGILRGGNPFGETDITLVKLFMKNSTFLATESKIHLIKDPEDLNIIIDYPDYRGELPLYSNEYLNRLKNAKAALR